MFVGRTTINNVSEFLFVVVAFLHGLHGFFHIFHGIAVANYLTTGYIVEVRVDIIGFLRRQQRQHAQGYYNHREEGM